jgi:hypothetical protein
MNSISDFGGDFLSEERDMNLNHARVSWLVVIGLLCWISPLWGQDKTGGAEPIDQSVDPSKLTYDILVDGNLPADDPGNKKFKTLQAAYAAAPEGTESKPTVIGIEPNVYQISGSDAPGPSLSVTKNWITLLGLTNNRRSVVLADNRGLDEGASDDGYMLDVNATGFAAKNLTLLNYCNCDYEYPGDASKSLKMRNPTITQAVALQASGDKHVYENVAILGRLDTMFLRTARSYFKNVYIEGTDDWMGGGQMSIWQDCELVYPNGRGVMSASNVVFFNCKFEANQGMEFYKAEFGSAARPDVFINCKFLLSSPKGVLAWVRGVAAPRPNQLTRTYKNTDANGDPVVFLDATEGKPALTYSRELTESELRAFNPWNLLRAAPNAKPDNWDPAGVREKYEKSEQGALVYRMGLRIGNQPTSRPGLGVGGFGGGIPSVSATIRTGGPGVTLAATVQPSYAADKTITWSAQSDLVSLSRTIGPNVVVTGNNTTEVARYVPIDATAADGFHVTAWVNVEPKFIDPPKVTSAPKLEAPADGKVTVDYGLDIGTRPDQSVITWYTCDDAAGTNPKIVAVSRGDEPLKAYTLMPGDVGKYLRVSVEPKLPISEAGPAVFATATAPIAAADISSTTVNPNFRNFVETPTDGPVSGRWSVEGTWTVLEGDNYANAFGIRAGTGLRGNRGEGASLLYFRDGDAADMQVDLEITPDKTEGTVFAVPGSPDDTGTRNSHGDIYIKYDPRTKTGYSLRYWRTTHSASACTYQFYKIEKGVGSPLNDTQVESGVFKRNTLITLKVVGSTISVEAHNTADNQKLSMQAAIEPNNFNGAGVAASGAASVYSRIRVSYP